MVWVLILLALGVLGCAYFVFCGALFDVCSMRGRALARKVKAKPPDPQVWDAFRAQMDAGRAWFEAQDAVPVSIKSRDGLALAGKYLACPGSENTILMVHGYRSSCENDFSCAFQAFYERGFNLLTIDQRAHGKSEGTYILFGAAERYDVVEWVNFLDATYHPKRIVLHGISMGASTVLMALDQGLSKSVVGAVADCGFTTPAQIQAYVMRRVLHMSPKWLLPGVGLIAKIRTGYWMYGASATESVRRAQVPVLFIHGDDDDYVPFRMGQANYDACPEPKWLCAVPGAGHGVSYMVDRAKCEAALRQFDERVLADPAPQARTR
ncbi:MAG: alpha/beta hydrolase [Clostridia bacterium]